MCYFRLHLRLRLLFSSSLECFLFFAIHQSFNPSNRVRNGSICFLYIYFGAAHFDLQSVYMPPCRIAFAWHWPKFTVLHRIRFHILLININIIDSAIGSHYVKLINCSLKTSTNYNRFELLFGAFARIILLKWYTLN